MSPTLVYVTNFALVIVLVLINAFFVVSEFSIVKIRRTKLEELAKEGNKRAVRALHITTNLDTYLSAVQLGITLASLGLGWIGEPAVSQLLKAVFGGYLADNPVLLHSISFGIAFTFITLLHVVLGELIPKSLAIQKTETFALWVAYPLYVFHKIFYPFIFVFDKLAISILRMLGVEPASEHDLAHSEEEIRLIVNASQKGGVIDHTESEIIRNAIDFSDISAREVMIPRQDMQCIFLDDEHSDILNMIKTTRHTRYPLCNEERDNVVGMIHMRDLLVHADEHLEKEGLRKIIREILFVPENQSISEILHQMMKKRIHMAVVVDEFGGTAGLLSMEDILEELVGDIKDEHDDEKDQQIKMIDKCTGEFDGLVLLEDAMECLGLPIEEHEEDTIGGYVFNLLARKPKVGDVVEDDYCKFEVLEVDRMRIKRLKVRPKS